jgi:hypothetical protein
MKAVSNTTPLRYLIAIERDDLLGQLFEKVFVPVAVYEELTETRTPETVRQRVSSLPARLEVRTVQETQTSTFSGLLYHVRMGGGPSSPCRLIFRAGHACHAPHSFPLFPNSRLQDHYTRISPLEQPCHRRMPRTVLFSRFELRSPSKYRQRPRAEAKPFYAVSSHRIFQATKMSMNTESGNHDE